MKPALDERGSAVVEFAYILPMLLIIFLGASDVCMLLERQIRIIHLSREAANVYSRGATAEETLAACTVADGDLGLDTPLGEVILTRVASDDFGNPVIVEQESSGSLGATSSVGSLPEGAFSAPATLPNGGELPPYTSLVVVEMFSQQFARFPAPGIWDGATLVLRSVAVF
ncbi:MAG TPA: TadE family protein [bacterium]|nr:TadE family protein [bacterium]